MKKYLKRVCEILLVSSSIVLGASPAISNEIEWVEVPGTYDEYSGNNALSIGTNTITRRGNAINFDLFSDITFQYSRISGNCRTGWLVSIASGEYNNAGQLVINERSQIPLDPRYEGFRLALEFACSQEI